jgi:hypothetical protein
LKLLFRTYTERKAEQRVLDFDDLLVFLDGLLADPAAGPTVRARFDAVLVDEYQDTNALQADLLERLRPSGRGLTVVGDDAQAIYSFRAATVRNILDFAQRYPGARSVVLTRRFRSTPTLLEATNRVIAQARERHAKDLWSARPTGERPELVTCRDEEQQSELVIERLLARREQGVDLRRQAVLFRASHHSAQLEMELGRRGIPFRKYGRLRFLEAAHVRDLLAFLRLFENPRDLVAGTRVLSLLPGIGPHIAETARARHVHGPHPELVDPDTWTDEHAFLHRDGMDRIQLEIAFDDRANVASYPAWQAYLREVQPPLLMVWGAPRSACSRYAAPGHTRTRCRRPRCSSSRRALRARCGGQQDRCDRRHVPAHQHRQSAVEEWGGQDAPR